MKTRIFNLIIIDESGSMQSIKNEAINNVNETIQTIRSAKGKHKDQEHYVSIVSFNNDVKTISDCVPVAQVSEIDDQSYQPNCCTALYDAMGVSLCALRKRVAEVDRVLVTIVTDGEENASKEYNCVSIKALVDELKAKGWVFAYIGANHDVTKVATKISITNVMSFEATSEGVDCMSAKLSHARSRLFDRMEDCCFSPAKANEDFFDDDTADDNIKIN